MGEAPPHPGVADRSRCKKTPLKWSLEPAKWQRWRARSHSKEAASIWDVLIDYIASGGSCWLRVDFPVSDTLRR
jgi:hypothetical protein